MVAGFDAGLSSGRVRRFFEDAPSGQWNELIGGRRMRIPRSTTRLWMVIVLGSGLGLGIVLPAAELAGSPESHVHGWIDVQASNFSPFHEREVASPFWPRYRLRLMGRPWQRLPICLVGKSRPGEACSIEDRDSFTFCLISPSPFYTPTIAMFRKVRAMHGLPPDPGKEVILSR
jgi:hypothetical protein